MTAPGATYRLQLHAGFPFESAARLLRYLRDLGVTHVYLSPVLQARKGSTHGYDVTDPTRASEALGGPEGFEALAAAARGHGLRVLLDIVPNHMAASEEGPWWRDVLRHGRSSAYAAVFDIDWEADAFGADDRLVLPILGDHYGRVLEQGELRLALHDDAPALRYFDRTLPLEPRSWAAVLAGRLRGLEDVGRGDTPVAAVARDIASALAALPPHWEPDTAAATARRDMAAEVHARFAAALRDVPGFRIFVEDALAAVNGRRGDAGSFDALDALLQAQPYALAYWRVASEEINYRRFFNIAELVGVRVEEPLVFGATHERVLDWVRRGLVHGLRIDHVDGLIDPTGYLRRLRRETGDDAWIVVEKILVGDEELPAHWPVAGTTGYDFATALNAALTDGAGLEALEAAYVAFTGLRRGFARIEYEKQRDIIRAHFAGEVRSLQRRLVALARGTRFARDVSGSQLGLAITEVTACLPVYRTYAREAEVSAPDRAVLARAVEEAARRNPALDDVALELLRRVLLLEWPEGTTPERRAAWLRFVLRWQQFTGPVMAKGVEDTSLYVYNRLVSLNEVGGDPGAGAADAAELHRRLAARQERWPLTMNATSTHDTKRSEDVRARLHALSEAPGEWAAALERWSAWNRDARSEVGGRVVPAPNEEVLVYQTLLGVWPLEETELEALPDRLRAYLTKAAREAKVHSSWLDPDEAYEAALHRFGERILDAGRASPFLDDFRAFQRRLAAAGAVHALTQLLLKVAAPGVPDFYQGTELWDLSLVDPDNRRPVDFDRRAAVLARVREALDTDPEARVRELLGEWRDGAIKLFVTAALLRAVAAAPDLFTAGEYLPLPCDDGAGGDAGLFAFARRAGDAWALAVVPLRVGLPGAEDAERGPAYRTGAAHGRARVRLPEAAPRRWVDVVTGAAIMVEGGDGTASLRVAEVLKLLPGAVLRGG